MSQINRLDRQRQVTLQASVAPGYGLADRSQALVQAAQELNMPAGYSTLVTGRGRELEHTFTEFLIAFAFSVVFMYMILASLYESISHPFTILLALPLAAPFALFSLWATGQSLNLYPALGMLVLLGVVKKNAILQIDHMNALRAASYPKLVAILIDHAGSCWRHASACPRHGTRRRRVPCSGGRRHRRPEPFAAPGRC